MSTFTFSSLSYHICAKFSPPSITLLCVPHKNMVLFIVARSGVSASLLLGNKRFCIFMINNVQKGLIVLLYHPIIVHQLVLYDRAYIKYCLVDSITLISLYMYMCLDDQKIAREGPLPQGWMHDMNFLFLFRVIKTCASFCCLLFW